MVVECLRRPEVGGSRTSPIRICFAPRPRSISPTAFPGWAVRSSRPDAAMILSTRALIVFPPGVFQHI